MEPVFCQILQFVAIDDSHNGFQGLQLAKVPEVNNIYSKTYLKSKFEVQNCFLFTFPSYWPTWAFMPNYRSKYSVPAIPLAYFFCIAPSGGWNIFLSKVCHFGCQTRCHKPTKCIWKNNCKTKLQTWEIGQNCAFWWILKNL